MIELPEAFVISKQLSKELVGKNILSVVAAQNPHKFAWYSGDPHTYNDLLSNKRIVGSNSFGGQLELTADGITLVFSDGVNLQYHVDRDSLPKKHLLFNAGLHPKKKVMALSGEEKEHLFFAVINTLFSMTEQGGRDTEKDIYGIPGGYQTILSKNTIGKPCKRCGSDLLKEAYMGGSIYYCSVCQQL